MIDMNDVAMDSLQGVCPCCRRPLDDIQYLFHAKSGALVINGTYVTLNFSEICAFKFLVKNYPKTVTVQEVQHDLNRSRPAGLISSNVASATVAGLRKKLEQCGLSINDKHLLLVKASNRVHSKQKRRHRLEVSDLQALADQAVVLATARG